MRSATYPRKWLRSSAVEWATVRPWVAVFVLEVWVVIAYFALTDATPSGEIRYLLYPLVWITVGAGAVVSIDPDARTPVHAGVAAVVGFLYFLVLLWVPGNIGLGTAGTDVAVRVAYYAPGWGPLIAVTSPWVRLFLVPFEVIGYAALAYLVYANVLALSRGAVSGTLGLVTCVGCTVPVLVPLIGILGGPATSLTTTAYAFSYDLGTLVFVATVALLYRSATGSRR